MKQYSFDNAIANVVVAPVAKPERGLKRAHNLEQSSFRRKLLAYQATWAQNLHRARFGWQRFRVLTITTSPDRLASMQAAARALRSGQGLFLFADAKTVRQDSDFFTIRWHTPQPGENVVLL